ncbi:DUF4124 domain-containing protein [uncultured Thiodictyon sp.]|uniref:DUF4124 domain-containing protein n=1 Tax=uncultured Thiodictyon sp. TaxID=1846217 RepID=UPI0025FB513E|nr:DUF4124 domain-containing protein [uncultured Thiodictyon sp.]
MNRRALATLLLPLSVWAGPYKCLQPDGSVVYQDTSCAIGAAGAELALDPSPPPQDHAGKGRAKDYSIEGQVKAMEAERNKARKERARAAAQARQTAKKKPGYDRAKCAKNRAEVARWSQQTHSTYRNISERDYREQKLEYHQALVDQYCRPD